MYNSDFRTVCELIAVMSVYGSFDPFENFVVGDLFSNVCQLFSKKTNNKQTPSYFHCVVSELHMESGTFVSKLQWAKNLLQ